MHPHNTSQPTVENMFANKWWKPQNKFVNLNIFLSWTFFRGCCNFLYNKVFFTWVKSFPWYSKKKYFEYSLLLCIVRWIILRPWHFIFPSTGHNFQKPSLVLCVVSILQINTWYLLLYLSFVCYIHLCVCKCIHIFNSFVFIYYILSYVLTHNTKHE